MSIFAYVLILLTAILLSNFIHRFIPAVSVPIIQIAMGALVTLIPLEFQLELEPSLFFVLFVAPIIFYNSMLSDKKTMWTQRKPILNMGILQVFATVAIVGYCVHLLIPTIPLAVSFALIGALGPTDDVAVASVSKRVNVPPKIMRILEGESIMNDASGIVSFQFALAAVLTGTFSIVEATGRFFVVALGGIAVGLLFSWIKYGFVRWIRSLGIENATLYVLREILTPFAIYLVAEALGVSGILAVFAAGIAHSFKRERFNPSTANLHVAADSIWTVLSFTLEGLVFLILGTQLPKILKTVTQNTYSISIAEIVLYVFFIVFLLLLIRFVWSVITIRPKIYADSEHPVSRWRAGVIFSLSGARGAVTLASVLSIPLLLSDGSAFPERNLLILLSSGVILVSLAVTNFILPLCVEKRAKTTDNRADNEACIEILRKVMAELKSQSTPENVAAISIITATYLNRIMELQHQSSYRPDRKAERRLKMKVYHWEKENVARLLERGEVDEKVASRYLEAIEVHLRKFSRNTIRPLKSLKRDINIFRLIRYNRRPKKNGEAGRSHACFMELIETNKRYILEKLKELENTSDNPVVRNMIISYEFSLSLQQRRIGRERAARNSVAADDIAEVAMGGFQIERDSIQTMFEANRISRETAREMRHNISLLEVQLKQDSF